MRKLLIGLLAVLLPTAALAGAVAVYKNFGGVASQQDVILNDTATYYYALTGFTPAATPTDIIVFKGSATKTVRIKYILIRGFATTAGSVPVQLIRRSTANSGGTAVTIIGVSADTNDAVATVVANYYTANAASLGTQVGGAAAFLGSQRLQLATAGVVNVAVQWSPGQFNMKSYVLHGVNDYLAINLGGATLPTGATLEIEMGVEEEI
jgi:hypothetical protein